MMFGLGKRTRHSTREDLSAYVDGEAPEAARLRVERHLEICAACRAEAAGLRSLVGLLRDMPEIEPSRSFTLAEAPARVPAAPVLQWVLRATALSTAVVFVVVFSADLAGVLPGDPVGIGVAPAPTTQPPALPQTSDGAEIFAEPEAAQGREGPPNMPSPAEDSIVGSTGASGALQPTSTGPLAEAARPVTEQQPPDAREDASNAYLPAIEGSLVALLVGAGGASLFLALRRRRGGA